MATKRRLNPRSGRAPPRWRVARVALRLPLRRAQNPALAGHAGVDDLAENLQLGAVDFERAVLIRDQHLARGCFGPGQLLRVGRGASGAGMEASEKSILD